MEKSWEVESLGKEKQGWLRQATSDSLSSWKSADLGANLDTEFTLFCFASCW